MAILRFLTCLRSLLLPFSLSACRASCRCTVVAWRDHGAAWGRSRSRKSVVEEVIKATFLIEGKGGRGGHVGESRATNGGES